MNRIRRGVAIPLAIVVGALMASLLSGCSIEGLVNNAVENATGGDVSLDGTLPADWPREVPVIDGKILFSAGGTSDGEKSWVVTITTEFGDPVGDARRQLEDAGFVVEATMSANPAVHVIAMKNDSYDVLVAGRGGGLIYTVTPITSEATVN